MREMKPGQMSAELVAALGITEGCPPPWLINMQRYGPPPSYPNMRIPGLNAPLPPGASYGYQPGGWGKPPVDEYGRPLYGDVFGSTDSTTDGNNYDALVDKSYRWGTLEFVDEEEEEEEEGEEDAEDGAGAGDGRPYDISGTETPLDGTHSVISGISGLETPDTIDLRKRAGIETPDIASVAGDFDQYPHKDLYHVIQEKQAGSAVVGQMFGSDRVYVLPGTNSESANLPVGEGAEDETREGKKRKLDASSAAVKRMKEYKF